MANMSYCRFQNTLEDLRDCLEAIQEAGSVEDLEQEFEAKGKDNELRALRRLVKMCREIAEYEEEEGRRLNPRQTNVQH